MLGKSVPISAKFLQANRDKLIQGLQALPASKQLTAMELALRTGMLTPGTLRGAIEAKAPKEMASDAARMQRDGKAVTVDSLLADYRSKTRFKKLAERVGLGEEWFGALAQAEVDKRANADR